MWKKKHSFVLYLSAVRTIACQAQAVFRIRSRICRIRKFWGHLDPDPLVRGPDPDSDLPLIKQKNNLYFVCFVTFLWLVICLEWRKCTSKSNEQNNLAAWRSLTKRAGSGSFRGTDPRIRVRTEMARIRNTDVQQSLQRYRVRTAIE